MHAIIYSNCLLFGLKLRSHTDWFRWMCVCWQYSLHVYAYHKLDFIIIVFNILCACTVCIIESSDPIRHAYTEQFQEPLWEHNKCLNSTKQRNRKRERKKEGIFKILCNKLIKIGFLFFFFCCMKNIEYTAQYISATNNTLSIEFAPYKRVHSTYRITTKHRAPISMSVWVYREN